MYGAKGEIADTKGICHYVHDAKSSQKSEKQLLNLKILKGILSKFGSCSYKVLLLLVFPKKKLQFAVTSLKS